MLLLTVWLLLTSSQTAEARDTIDVVLSQVGVIDVCGEKADKDIIILINVGRVLQSDSLFGFNFEIKYDSVKFKFHTPVYLNTLAEFFDIKDINFGKKGLARGYASVGLFGSQISGNRPLIGIYGDYLGDCPDSSIISLSYIEFTDEFKKVIRRYVPTTVQALELDNPDRFLKIVFENDSAVNLSKDTTINIKFDLKVGKQLKLDTANLEIVIGNKDLISIEDIYYSGGLEFVSSNIIDDYRYSLKVKFKNFIDNSVVMKAKVNQNKNDSSWISVKPTYTNDCSCVKRLLGDSILIKSKKKNDTSTVVWDKADEQKTLYSYYDNKSEAFCLDFSDNINGNLKLFNLNGSLIAEKNINWSNNVTLEGNYLNKGIYLAIINSNLKIYKIILIKN